MRSRVLRLKYGKKKHHAYELAVVVHRALLQLSLVPRQVVVTWAPTTDDRIKRRGFDQAELIARHVGVLLGARTIRLLRRTSRQTQTGSGRHERLNTPSFIGRGHAKSPAVIVIDDVVTTGATLLRAAEELSKDGYSLIICIAPSHKVAVKKIFRNGSTDEDLSDRMKM